MVGPYLAEVLRPGTVVVSNTFAVPGWRLVDGGRVLRELALLDVQVVLCGEGSEVVGVVLVRGFDRTGVEVAGVVGDGAEVRALGVPVTLTATLAVV